MRKNIFFVLILFDTIKSVCREQFAEKLKFELISNKTKITLWIEANHEKTAGRVFGA